jgi:16S rRNA (uracil1498-N3)-methyltransferase
VRRLFVSADQLLGATATVGGEAHRHLARVLRARPGERVVLFDGLGDEVEAEVVAVERDATRLALGQRRTVELAGRAEIVLLQGLARGERMDFIVQKTTELGVSRIVPVIAGRSIAKLAPSAAGAGGSARRARWEKIAREAARQSGRADVPRIADAVPLDEALAAARSDAAARPEQLRLALWEASRGHPLRQALRAGPRAVTLLVGPEGGFAAEEMADAAASGFEVVGLGPRILRVETAAVVAVALVQAAAGGLD